jgi:hypothetical protein
MYCTPISWSRDSGSWWHTMRPAPCSIGAPPEVPDMSQFALKWIFVLDADYAVDAKAYLPGDFTTGCAFEDRSGRRRLEIHPGGIVKVLASYAWDGCTPKFAIWDVVIGAPDGVPNSVTKKPKAHYASLIHDALYQFLDDGLPITRHAADRLFPDARRFRSALDLLHRGARARRGRASNHALEAKLPGAKGRAVARTPAPKPIGTTVFGHATPEAAPDKHLQGICPRIAYPCDFPDTSHENPRASPARRVARTRWRMLPCRADFLLATIDMNWIDR